MVEFARYYIEFIKKFFNNIGTFFRSIFSAIGKFFGTDIKNYFITFGNYSQNFTILDWFVAIIVIIINLAFITFVLIRLYQLIRKYVKFSKNEIEKDYLLEEIALLSQRAVQLTSEKNKILELKMESFGMNPELFEQKDKSKVKEKVASRFNKLITVDEKYNHALMVTNMTEENMLTLSELVDRFINFSASRLGLFYDRQVVANFFAGMAASKIIILEGISGTGKTSLPYAMGEFFNNRTAMISVQPSWRDRTEMIGYLNEFTKKFNETDFLASLYESTYRDDLNFIVLDELNLARIEYYFAEFLSIMEMPKNEDWKIDVVPSTEKGDPVNLINGKITVPQNLWFVGTANKDDSTFTITDKVYDRAISIEMDTKADYIDAPYTEGITIEYDYLNKLFKEAKKTHPLTSESINDIEKLDKFITNNFKITFGNRIMKQIHDFVPVYVASGGTEYEALDYILTRKVLRKLESLNLPFLQEELKALDKYLDQLFGKDVFRNAKNYIEELQRLT